MRSRTTLARWLLVGVVVVGPVVGCREGEPSTDPGPVAPEPVEVPMAEPAPAAPPRRLERRAPANPSEAQRSAYDARRPKTALELQLYREEESAPIEDGSGNRGRARLVHLNRRVNDWLVLEVEWEGSPPVVAHLQNPEPDLREIALDPAYPFGLVIETDGDPTRCDLWSGEAAGVLADARASREPFAPLCGGLVYLRSPTGGRKTAMERTTDFLRDRIWSGEKITVFVREKFFKDAFLETSETVRGRPGAGQRPRPPGAPRRPWVDPAIEGRLLSPSSLGLELEYDGERKMLVGRWYAVRRVPGVFVSAIEPRHVAPELVERLRRQLNPLDEIESSALVYTVAFDLDLFEVGFALGTDHPRVDWSDRVPAVVRTETLPGPDGIGSAAPLVRIGQVAPWLAERTVATFTGGFKRTHGAFRSGELATKNFGSHYGFIEHGAIVSKLQPGLATLVVDADGEVDLRTWTPEDDADLPRIRHARQNGLPMVEPDPETGEPRPGRLVPNWSQGNWSGSVDKRLRALRAGACLQESEESRFLLYGYFSSATPSAMARVFMAYGCSYAMLLDMNALEHTYLAIYSDDPSGPRVDHLIEGMDVLDETVGETVLPRFLGFSDNRDFFYLASKEAAQ